MIWRLTYCNKDGVEARLDIIRGASTPVEVIEGTATPFILNYKMDKSDKSGHIMSSSADISIFETHTFNIDNLKTSSETEIKVEHYINGVLDWSGFVIPDFFSKTIGTPSTVEMVASDRLGTLKGVTLEDLNQYESMRDLAVYCLAKTGLTLPLYTMADFGNAGQTNAFFKALGLSGRLSDTKGRNISCYNVLKSILVASESKLVQQSGAWYIVNKFQHEQGSGNLFSTLTASTAYSEQTVNFSDVHVGARRTIIPVGATTGVFQEFGGGRSYPDNFDFRDGQTGWTTAGTFVATIDNREITRYNFGPVGATIELGDPTDKNYLLNKNVFNVANYIQSADIDVPYDTGRIEVVLDINAIGPRMAQAIAAANLRVSVGATSGSQTLWLNTSGVFQSGSVIIHNLYFSRGVGNFETANFSVKGVLEQPSGYNVFVRIYGSNEAALDLRETAINFATISFNNTIESPKGLIYRRNQGTGFTKEHDIDTSIFGDYMRKGLDGYFYEYRIDDTSSLYSTAGTLTEPIWTAYNDTEQLPLLRHVTRQKSRMFSVAHNMISARVDVSTFKPLSIFVDCNSVNPRHVVVSASYDFLRSEVEVELEQIAYATLDVREYIYSYFGEGESGISSVGGIASGSGGGGSGGGMTADQVAILSEVQVLAHDHGNKEVLDQVTQDVVDNALREMIISTDTETELTDENYLSSLRVLKEILDNNEYLRTQFLSKVNPDTAQEIIKFVKGIEIGTFTTGPLGAGAAIKMENGVSRMEVDQLYVRMRATFRELIIESLKHIGGQLILSPARMKCTSVVDGGTYYRCYFDTGDGKVSNEFVAGDQARCQVFTGSGVKMYWRLVTSVGTDWINLSKTDAISGSSIPEAGDDIVQLGNRSDATRQNAQILSTVGSDAPSWKQYKGINAFSLEGKDTTVFSGTGNKIDGKTVFMSSGANVEDGINSKNSNYSSQPTSYKANDTWTLSADTTVNGTAYKQGEILTATQDSTTFVQSHWVKKVRYTDDTAVENLQIGGVNLINGDTKLIERTAVGWTHIPLSKQLVEGKTYILGGEFRIDTGTNGVIGLNNADFNTGLVVPPINIPFVATAYMASRTHFALAKQTGTSPDLVVSAKEVKLEEGNKKTAWAQSPEYIQTKIDAAKQEALTAAGNAQTSANTANTAVGNLNTYVDGSFKDGVIEASEAKAIEKYINIVNTEKSNLEATYNTLYANTYLEGTPKTNLLNAKVTYFGAVDTLLNSINTAISDGKTTIAEKNAVDSNYTSYKSALASLQTAIENANKAIQTKLDTLSTDKINNIQIGGINLITGDTSLVARTAVGWTHIPLSKQLVEGKTYILGGEFRIDTGTNGVIGLNNADFNTGLVVPPINIPFVATAYMASRTHFALAKQTGTSPDLVVSAKEVKLEEGNKKTAWSQSPEYVKFLIDTEKTRINEILSDNLADPSEKQYLSNLWQEIYAEYPRIWAQANTYAIDKSSYEAKYTALNNLLSPVLANLTVNSTVAGASIRTAFSQYYDARIFLQNAITNKVNQNAGDAKLTAEQAQLAADGYMRARYIRDWVKGSSVNNDNHWSEVKIINKSGTNLANGKTPTTNGTFTTNPSTYATDNNLSTYASVPDMGSPVYIQIDLGQIYYDIDYIQIWHYYLDGRTYYGTKTEISIDGVNWTPVFDSAKSGTYKETAAGNIISFRPNEVLAKVLKGAAVTDTFKTTINGGLISTVITEYRELNSEQVTGLISGIQGANKNLPFLVAGGTYAEGIAGTAKAIIRHDGTVKFTSAEITGTVNAISGTFNNVIFQSGHIGGFRVSGTGLTNGPDFNNDAYIIFRNDENKTFAGIGGDVLPSSSGLTAVARFENGATNNFYGSTNYGVIIEVSGASRNIGISLVGDIVMKGALVSIEPTFQSTGYTDSIIVNISKYRRFLFTPGTSQYLSVDLPSSSQIVNAFGSYKLPTYWNIEIEIEVAWNASGSIALRGSSGSIFVNNNGDVVNHEDTYAYGIIKMKKGDVVTVRYNSYHGRWQLINHSY